MHHKDDEVHMNNSDMEKFLIAFDALAITSIVLLILILLPPLFSKAVHRRLPWYSHMLAWLVISVALCLMIGHQRDPQPPAGLCFVQSALLYATPPLISFSMACNLLDVNLALNALLSKKSLRKRKVETSVILGFFPWIVFWGVIIEVSVIFITSATKFYPSGNRQLHLFCHYNSKTTNAISGSLILIAFITLILAKGNTFVWAAVLLIRKFRSYAWSSVEVSQMVLSAFIRNLVFLGLALTGIVISQVSYTVKSHDAAWSLAIPTLPIIAAVIYGVHADVIRCITFQKKRQSIFEPETEKPPVPPPKDEKYLREYEHDQDP